MPPCGGPSKDYAYKVGEEAYNDVLSLLRDKYQIYTDDKTLEFYRKQPGFGHEQVTKAMDDLKVAVQEMVWNDHAASF